MDNQSEKSIGEEATLAGRGKPSASARDVSIGDERTLTGDLAIQETLLDDIEIVDLEARYTVEAELGEGGMGAVVLATDTRLGRKVAIKRILGEAARSKAAVARFLTEARAIAAMSHPNVVQIYELGVAKSGPFLVIEYIDGGSLLDRCKAGPIPAGEAVSVVCQVCDGLAKAHDAGIIHRDIKPANILLTKDGIPKLTDFGLAKAEAADHQMTMTGAVMGTPDFMPPEQRRDAALVDHRSDLWSLAATLYQMVSGRSPKVIRLHELPQDMQPILAKALEDEKDARYQSAKELREALNGIRFDSQKPVIPAHFEGDLQEGQCKACGTVTSDLTKKFCRNPKCGASLRVSCLACNAQIPIWDGVCGECGGNQPSLLEEKRKSAEVKKAEAESLLADLAFDEATAQADELAAETRVELGDLAEWAKEFIRSTRLERDRQFAVAAAHLEDAKKHSHAFDYPAAIQAIETIPQRLRNAEASGIMSDCKARHEEVGKLIPEIAARVSRKDVDGLLSIVERATELRGDRQDLVKIRQQLRERRDGRLARVKAKLEAGDVVNARGILDRTDPRDLGPVGKELNERVQNILAMEAKLSAMCKEARSDGVVTLEEAKCILDVCVAYLSLNPKNDEVRRLESTCRQNVAKSAPPKRRVVLPTTTADKIAWCRAHDSKIPGGRAQGAAKKAAADASRDAAAKALKKFFNIKTLEFTDDNFQSDVLGSSAPVLVDFWAPWCGSCRTLGPVIEELAAENADTLKVGKVNVDENNRLALAYNVTSIPTIMIFNGGKLVQQLTGVQSKGKLQQALDEVNSSSLAIKAAQMPPVQKRVIEIVASQLGVSKDDISPETLFIADLGADSLDAVELVMDLEEEFDINIPDEIVEKIRTVGQAVAYLEANFG